MWKFALVLAAVHGASCIAPSIYWVLETLKCSEHRVIVSPNKNLVETPEVLDQMCKQQDEFFRCLENLASLMEPASVELSSKIANERSVFNSLCSAESPWRRRYLELAPCINLQQTDFCKTPEFLGADGTDLGSPAVHVEEKKENCIAMTLSMKCGVEAGQLFQYLLKLKGDDIFQPVDMTYSDSDPCSKENPSTERVFGEISDQLVKEMDYIPEQDSADSFVLHKRVGHMHEELESVNENISRSLETENTDQSLHLVELENGSENAEHEVTEDKDSVSEVTTSTLGSANETSVEGISEKPYVNKCIHIQDFLRLKDVFNFYADLSVDSLIEELFRETRTLNPEENYETVRIFPDGRINYYSRRRDIQFLETIKCYNFPDYFVCINKFRSYLPYCLLTTDFTGPREGEFFPEEFDPEFSAQWYETTPKEVLQSIGDVPDQQSYTSSSNEDAEAGYAPVDGKESEDGVEQSEDVDAVSHIASKDSLSLNIMKDSGAYEFKRENKAEIFKYFTASLPSASKIEIKNLLPKHIVEELINLHKINRASVESVKIRSDYLGNIYIFWSNQQEFVIDTISCEMVNECHPKGEGKWKCVIVPRPNNKTDGLAI